MTEKEQLPDDISPAELATRVLIDILEQSRKGEEPSEEAEQIGQMEIRIEVVSTPAEVMEDLTACYRDAVIGNEELVKLICEKPKRQKDHPINGYIYPLSTGEEANDYFEQYNKPNTVICIAYVNNKPAGYIILEHGGSSQEEHQEFAQRFRTTYLPENKTTARGDKTEEYAAFHEALDSGTVIYVAEIVSANAGVTIRLLEQALQHIPHETSTHFGSLVLSTMKLGDHANDTGNSDSSKLNKDLGMRTIATTRTDDLPLKPTDAQLERFGLTTDANGEAVATVYFKLMTGPSQVTIKELLRLFGSLKIPGY